MKFDKSSKIYDTMQLIYVLNMQSSILPGPIRLEHRQSICPRGLLAQDLGASTSLTPLVYLHQ